jgi:putative solute:sodium symporter small subunit
MNDSNHQIYWRKNLKYLTLLLSIWFIVSFGFSIIFADTIDNVKFAGFKLGFWFAQQGSIFVFVLLIFAYVRLMNRLDKNYNVDEK